MHQDPPAPSRRVPLKDSSKHFVNRVHGDDDPLSKAVAARQKASTASAVVQQAVAPIATVALATTRMTGNELREWQQSWRRIMKVSVVYFEDSSSKRHFRDIARATSALENLGARVAKFFSDSVTIIISTRPYNKHGDYPLGDIFRVARRKELKVWNFDKVYRFMHHLGEAVHDDASEKLSSLLRNEKLFGPNDRDPQAKRDDIKYFTNLYLYAYDLRQQTRPIAIREWGRTAEYPRLCPSTNGRSLFVADSKPHSINSTTKRHARRLAYLEETADYRKRLVAASYEGTGEEPPTFAERVGYKQQWEARRRHSDVDLSPDPLKLVPVEKKRLRRTLPPAKQWEVEEPKLPVLDKSRPSLLRQTSTVALTSGASKFKNDYGEIQASGVQNQSGSAVVGGGVAGVGNGLAPSYSLVHNKKIANDQKKMMVLEQSTLKTVSPVAVNKENVPPEIVTPVRQQPPPAPAAPQCYAAPDDDTEKVSPDKVGSDLRKPVKDQKRKRETKEVDHSKRAKHESKPGYCENCRVKYSDFEAHITMDKHRQFATDGANFDEIDQLIDTVKMTRMMGL